MASVREVLIKFLGESGSLKRATGEADRGFKGLSDRLDHVKRSFGAGEGFTGKLKSGWAGVGEAFSGSAAKFAVASAGVAAVGAAAAKAVTEFQDATLEVGKFRDATGVTSEEASRFVEVFNDLGIGADAGQAAIGRFSKALGANADAFADYGLQVVRAADGTVNMAATFVAAVDALNRIEDPAKRAAAGAAMFGRGWQEMAEVIASGAPALKQALDGVQASKVFSDADIESGRELRDAFDSLRDAGEGLLLTLGKALAPAISKLAPIIGDLVAAAEPLIAAFGDVLAQALESIVPLIGAVVKAVGPLLDLLADTVGVIEQIGDATAKALAEMVVNTKDITPQLREMGMVVEDTATVVKRFEDALDEATTAATKRFSETQALLEKEKSDREDYYRSRIEAEKEADRIASGNAQRLKWLNAKAALDEYNASLEEQVRMQDELLSAEMSAVDTQFRVQDSFDSTRSALARYMEAGEKTPQLLRDVTQAAWGSAGAVLADAQAKAELAGATLDASDKQAILLGALQNMANAPGVPPEVRDSILGVAADIQKLPESKTIKVNVDLTAAEQMMDPKAQWLRDQAAKPTIKVDADTTPATSKLTALQQLADDTSAKRVDVEVVTPNTAPATMALSALGRKAAEVSAQRVSLSVGLVGEGAVLAALDRVSRRAQAARDSVQLALRAGSVLGNGS